MTYAMTYAVNIVQQTQRLRTLGNDRIQEGTKMKKLLMPLLMLNMFMISLNIFFKAKNDWILIIQILVGLLLVVYGVVYLKKKK